MKNCIYMTCDNSYERYVKPCINSIKQNWKNHPDIIMYCNDLNPSFEKWLLDKGVFIKNYVINEYKNLGPVNNNIVYNKYICWNPDYLKEYDNILHMDCDIIVLKDLNDMFNTKKLLCFNNNEILDSVTLFKNNDDNLISLLKEYKINNETMCNAGIFVITKKDRTIKNYNLLLEITKKFEKYLKYADQTVISLYCHIKKIKISDDVYYNFQPHFMNYKNKNYKLDDIKILHFTARKPDTITYHLWGRLDGYHDIMYKIWNQYTNS